MDLEDPAALATFLVTANIKLIRAEWLGDALDVISGHSLPVKTFPLLLFNESIRLYLVPLCSILCSLMKGILFDNHSISCHDEFYCGTFTVKCS